MSLRHPNVAKVELIAQALGPLRDQLVFVGGCAVDLLLTDTAAAAPRVTYDVDLLVQVAALPGYHAMEKQFPGSVSSAMCRRMRRFAAGCSATYRWI